MSKKNIIKEIKNGFCRQLELSTPFDRRHSDPKKDYGIHGITLCCTLLKDKKAVQFVAYLPVYLPHVADELLLKSQTGSFNPFYGMGADVGYHSPTPTFEGQKPILNCQFTEGDCYYDSSSSRAEDWYKIFLQEGLDVIWEKLEKMWIAYFEAKK